MSFLIRFFSQKKQIDIEKKNSRKVKIEEDDEPGQNSCKEVKLEECHSVTKEMRTRYT